MLHKIKHIAISAVLITVLGFSVASLFSFEEPSIVTPKEIMAEIPSLKYEFGLPLDSFKVVEGKIKKNQFLADILLKHHVPYVEIDRLVKTTKEVFDIRKIAVGKNYTILCNKDSIEKAKYFIYQPNSIDYVVFEMGETTKAYKAKKEVITNEKFVEGVINSSLYQTLVDAKVSPKLAVELANIYAWTIDFYRIQKGDNFKVIYEELIVDGEAIGIGEIKSAIFNHRNNEFYAFYFEQNGVGDYFDEEANSLRKAFLKAPLKFSRITSGYTLKRYHPVQKRNKPHYGTDYAAPRGTPIMAVGTGVVIDSRYSKYNGNYVKIKHNGTYTTQYLHMTKRNVTKGQSVKQGDIIGSVGSTGLATGPHVCFRFWKNGKQVDHLKEKFPPSLPVEKKLLPEFKLVKEDMLEKLNANPKVEV